MGRLALDRARLYSPAAFEVEANTLRAMAHPKRLMILSQLGDDGRSVSELAHAVGISLQNASQHLRVLRDRGVVVAERAGHEVKYRLASPEFQTCCALVREVAIEGMRRREAELDRSSVLHPLNERIHVGAIPA